MASARRHRVRMGTSHQELLHPSQRHLHFAMNRRMVASCFRLKISKVGLKVVGQFAPIEPNTD